MEISFRKQADIKNVLDKHQRSQDKDFQVGDHVRFEDWDGTAEVLATGSGEEMIGTFIPPEVVEEIHKYGSGTKYANEKIGQYRKSDKDFNMLMDALRDDATVGVIGSGLNSIFCLVKFEDGALDIIPKEEISSIA